MKISKVLVSTLGIAFTIGISSLAGNWGKNSNGWFYLNDDGSYTTSQWQWIDGNNDGNAECYYFDAGGYLLTNTIVDGYEVNSDGAWTENGNVQIKQVASNAIGSGSLQPGKYYQKSSYTNYTIYRSGSGYESGTNYFGEDKDEYIVLSGTTDKLNFEYYNWTTTREYPEIDALKMKGTFTRNSDGSYSVKNIDHTERINGKIWYPDELDFTISSISNITDNSFVIYIHSEGDGGYDTYTTMIRE